MDAELLHAAEMLGSVIPPKKQKGLEMRRGTVAVINADGSLLIIPDGFTKAIPCGRACNPKVGDRVIILISGNQWCAIATIGGDSGGSIFDKMTPEEAREALGLGAWDSLSRYSTDEQDTGWLWVDDKLIYRKVYQYGSVGASIDFVVGAMPAGLDTLIWITGIGVDSYGNRIPLPYPNTSTSIGVGNRWLYLSPTQIILGTAAMGFVRGHVIIYYTK